MSVHLIQTNYASYPVFRWDDKRISTAYEIHSYFSIINNFHRIRPCTQPFSQQHNYTPFPAVQTPYSGFFYPSFKLGNAVQGFRTPATSHLRSLRHRSSLAFNLGRKSTLSKKLDLAPILSQTSSGLSFTVETRSLNFDPS
ncbi:hypothetical protein DSO57_1032222 [Entomophthora muscae]|uniref:Uncharacterized protein n=1 Tax=Entomophthora muscae TaxID=34485 RepID=A0ACC2TYZ4_9FUNG|nr:hypothetical protein DSO57_1032222 [Entomophthora muscae]